MDSINPNFKKYTAPQLPKAVELFSALQKGNRAALSKALTLVESKNAQHRTLAEALVKLALPLSGNALRIGITGVPGVGKSTFIEAFGEYLTTQGKKIAVLAVDPSSTKNRGSILGDKTRMYKLSQNPNAFIRPSPSAGSLGGVANKTRESILLCEAAGFDIILVETVGVGQSETAVKNMVDFFMLLMLAGAGDELQGIKRGIMEMADLLLINKADGENAQNAKLASGEYKRALHLLPPNENDWIPQVKLCSALNQIGIEGAWRTIQEFENQQKLKGYFEGNRIDQNLHWFDEALGQLMLTKLQENHGEQLKQMHAEIIEAKLDPYKAAKDLVEKLF